MDIHLNAPILVIIRGEIADRENTTRVSVGDDLSYNDRFPKHI